MQRDAAYVGAGILLSETWLGLGVWESRAPLMHCKRRAGLINFVILFNTTLLCELNT